MALIQNALSAMNPTPSALAYSDSVAAGTLSTFSSGGQRVDTPITLKSKGTTESRVEVQAAKGTRIGISNNGQTGSLRPDNSVRTARGINTLTQRVDYIPIFSFLSEWQNPNVKVENVGVSSTTSQLESVVALSLAFGQLQSDQNLALQRTRILFYIDQATQTLAKIDYSLFPEDGSNSPTNMEVLFADYRPVGGILVPFQQTTYRDGNLESLLTLSSVTFNVGLSDSEFVLP